MLDAVRHTYFTSLQYRGVRSCCVVTVSWSDTEREQRDCRRPSYFLPNLKGGILESVGSLSSCRQSFWPEAPCNRQLRRHSAETLCRYDDTFFERRLLWQLVITVGDQATARKSAITARAREGSMVNSVRSVMDAAGCVAVFVKAPAKRNNVR